ncbi:hypothetical protein [Anaerotignum lactatifermentans]|nr:hypothetical protein [Anaerotignum lactatifermentans]
MKLEGKVLKTPCFSGFAALLQVQTAILPEWTFAPERGKYVF